MDVTDDQTLETARPRTSTVLALFLGAALILSYLAAYAVVNALVSADVISPWPRDRDPRPRWMIVGFLTLTGLFVAIGATLRLLSRRQLLRIDEMESSDQS